MANESITIPGRTSAAIAADKVGGEMFQRVKLTHGAEGAASNVTTDTPLPVILVGGGGGGSSDALSDSQLRASPVPVSGTFYPPVQPISATALPLPSGAASEATLALLRTAVEAIKTAAEALNTKTAVVNTGAIAGTVALDGFTLAALETINAATGLAQPLTDTQLRASPVPVAVEFPATQPVSGTISVSNPGLTDAQLRAEAVPVSAAALPLPAGAATQTTLAAVEAKLPALSGGRLPVVLPAGGSGLTDAELRATPLPVSCADLATIAASLHNEDAAHVSGDAGQLMLGVRWDTDVATADNGDYSVLKLDEAGRLKVSTMPASYADITGDITAVQAAIGTPVAGGTVSGDVSRASNVMMFCTGTFAGVNVSFEGSLEATGETNWFGIQAVRSNANTVETATGVLAAQPVYAWELSVNGLARVRVRCTARTSGTQSWRFKLGTYATEPIPAAQISGTQPVSGTVTAIEGTPMTPTASIINSAASTNGTVVKASAGTLYGVVLSNNGASDAWFKLHNSTTVTVGTTAVAMWIKIPAGSNVNVQWGSKGLRHGTGICCSITGAVGDTDTTAVAAGQVKVNLSYV